MPQDADVPKLHNRHETHHTKQMSVRERNPSGNFHRRVTIATLAGSNSLFAKFHDPCAIENIES